MSIKKLDLNPVTGQLDLVATDFAASEISFDDTIIEASTGGAITGDDVQEILDNFVVVLVSLIDSIFTDLSGKQDTSEKDQANGYAGLDGSSLIALYQLANVVSDTAYAGSWNGVTDIAPSKNAVYDAIVATIFNGGTITNDLTIDGANLYLDNSLPYIMRDDTTTKAAINFTTGAAGAGDKWRLGMVEGSDYFVLRQVGGIDLLFVTSAGEFSFHGPMTIDGNQLKGMADPTDIYDGTNKQYVDAADSALSSGKQNVAASLTAFSTYDADGFIVQVTNTGSRYAARAIQGTAGQVNVMNGNGVAGDPVISLAQDLATTSTPRFANVFTALNVKTGNYTLTNSDSYIICHTGPFTITLNSAATVGRLVTITNIGAGAITVNTTASETIDDVTSRTLAQWESLSVVSSGNYWTTQSKVRGYVTTDLASGVLDTDLSSVSGSDDTIPSAKATRTAMDLKVSDTAYAGSWDAVTTIAPSKNAVYDKINALPTVATDTIFDAKGDLAVGTGADAAAKLTVGSDGQIAVANSNSSSGLIYARQTGMNLTSGEYTGTQQNQSNATMNNQRLYYLPFFIHKRVTIIRIGVNHAATIAGAGSVVRLGIYTPHATNISVPDALVADYGTIATDTAAALKLITISQVLDPGLYFAAAVAQTVSGSPTFNTGPPAFTMSDTAGTSTGTKFQGSISGTLPGNATPGAANATQPPVIFLGI